MRNILVTFDNFAGNEILTERNVQDYHSLYIDLYNELRKTDDAEKEIINDDLVFEMELVKQIEINIDYILGLIKRYHEDHTKNKEILVDIVFAACIPIQDQQVNEPKNGRVFYLNQADSLNGFLIFPAKRCLEKR